MAVCPQSLGRLPAGCAQKHFQPSKLSCGTMGAGLYLAWDHYGSVKLGC